MQRRSFIRQTAAILGTFALHHHTLEAFSGLPDPNTLSAPDNYATDEDFWRQIRQAYASSPTIANFNNGGISPAPRATMDALDYYNRMCNEVPSHYMWRILEHDREPLRQNLAHLAGCDPEELAINRNATESLNTIIFGLPLRAGDEVVLSKYDYPNMISAWKQREKRDGIKLVWVDFEAIPCEDDAILTAAYTEKFTDKTRLVHITHVINWSGQIIPARRIADAAHARGIEVLIDAAHSFALLDYKIPDLGGDYWGTSLHKWLCAPFGSGMMWIKKEKIASIWPLLGNDKPDSTDIRKFETLGTRSFPIEMAIGYSLDLHNLIGTRRKQERLQFLKNRWMQQTQDIQDIYSYTSLKPEFGCAIGCFGIKGFKPTEILTQLFSKYGIHTVAIDREKISGVRVAPNVYTTLDEVDKLSDCIRKIRG